MLEPKLMAAMLARFLFCILMKVSRMGSCIVAVCACLLFYMQLKRETGSEHEREILGMSTVHVYISI